MRVGFVGLGSMGAPMARRLADSGSLDVVVWARRPESLEPFQSGPARIAGSLAELAEGLDVLCTCVFDAAGTREILFGPGGAAHSLPRGSVIMCHSTVAPNEIVDIATEAASYGLRVLDAPVSGGAPKVEAGELVVMIGGEQATLEDVQPLLQVLTNTVVYLGAVGSAQQAKLLNNTLLSAHMALAHDVFSLADELGVDRAGLGEILRNGSGRSYGAEMYSRVGSLEPLAHTTGPTLSKDVQLLSDLVRGRKAGSLLLPPATELMAEFKRISNT